jgi:serine/threonine protein kinase
LVLTPGTRLGSYEITVQIGGGGMGEVYRTTDTNLKRQVAIKVLHAPLRTHNNKGALTDASVLPSNSAATCCI